MEKLILTWFGALLIASTVFADDVTMATSDNLDDFAKRVEVARGRENVAEETGKSQVHKQVRSERERKARDRRSNFGAIVSAEAKRYKEEGLDKSKQFGEWVSNQRSHAQEHEGMQGGNGAQISSVVRDSGSDASASSKRKNK